ncbi:MAG TPA: DUF1573 domain-containing protein [Flavobacteriales bacterium]|nr:DUF1573 domain-containing protein [Flavobacteriales bacterium]
MSMKSLFTPFALAVACTVVLVSSCQLTDYSEHKDVTTDDINFGKAGYENVDKDKMPAITFDSQEHDMGKVVQGAQVVAAFKFTNTGGSPLVIADVRSTCGCTVAKDWPKTPILPGEGGSIGVSFDSNGREGSQHKVITVIANTEPPSTALTLIGEVIGPTPAE